MIRYSMKEEQEIQTFKKSAKIMDLWIYKVAWSPYIFLAKITNLMIRYPLKEKQEKKLVKKSAKIMDKGINE